MMRFLRHLDVPRCIGATLALIVLFACAAFAGADDYGWTQRGNYWYYSAGTDAYTRTQAPGYYRYGCYYPGQYTYTFHHAGYSAPKLKLPTYSENWRSEAISFIKAKQDRQEFASFMAAAGYPMNGMADYSHAAYQLGAATGSTGYTYANSATFYGDAALNLSAQFQSLARLAENSQTGTKQLTTDFADLLGQASEGQKQIAEILARGQVLAQLARSLDGNKATIQEKSTSFQTLPTGNGGAWQQSAGRCVKCHSGATAEGKFDVTQYRLLDATAKLKVVGRLLRPAEHPEHMPKGGPSLPPGEIALWLSQ